MLKWLIGLLASISSVFTIGANKLNVAPPLNTAIIAYQKTYYAPVVADLGNFPWANKISEVPISVNKPVSTKPTPPPQQTVPTPPLPLPIVPATPAPPQDPYLANPEPIENWFRYSEFNGSSIDGDRTLPEITFDREYWRIEALSYWAPAVTPPKPETQNDYFKLEVYEKGTNKLIYTMASGTDEIMHKFQAFRKPGAYYFKIYTKDPSQYEVTFTISSKLAQ